MTNDIMLLAGVVCALILGGGAGFWIAHLRQQARLQKVTLEANHQAEMLAQQVAQLQQTVETTRAVAQQAEAHGHAATEARVETEKKWVQAQEQIRLHGQTLERLQQTEGQVASLQQSLKTEHGRAMDLEARLQAAQRETGEKVKLLQEAREQMKLEFQAIAQKLFDDKSEKFSQHNKSSLGELLNPLKDQLGEFRKKIEDVYDKETRDRVSLFNEIVALKDLNVKMSTEALNLTRALKGDSKAQGNWGEMVLEKVLEASGLQKGREYETQGNYSNEDGQRLRPDVIVHLPDNKQIVIDAKVSLTAWERYSADAEATDDGNRAVHLQSHIDSLKTHIRALSGKNYQDLYGINTPDYVLMFVPIEPAFLKALEMDPELFSQAFQRNIMLVCPSTLLVSLKTIHSIWRYEYQNRHALEIADQAGKLHDQFVLFAESLQDVGIKIGKAQEAYDMAHKRLVSGKGNLVRRVEQLETLGAKARKKMPEFLRDPDADSSALVLGTASLETTTLETASHGAVTDEPANVWDRDERPEQV